jgi:uncharacterized membrane protein
MDYRIISILITVIVSSIIFVIGSKERVNSSVSDSNIEYVNQKKYAIIRCLYLVLEFDRESIIQEGSNGIYVNRGNDPINNFEKIYEYVDKLYESDNFYYNSKHGSSLILGRCIDLIDDEEFGKFLEEINN